MNVELMRENLGRMSGMKITGDEAQWIIGRLSGLTEMSEALDALTDRRADLFMVRS